LPRSSCFSVYFLTFVAVSSIVTVSLEWNYLYLLFSPWRVRAVFSERPDTAGRTPQGPAHQDAFHRSRCCWLEWLCRCQGKFLFAGKI